MRPSPAHSLRFAGPLLLLTVGCEITPNFVDGKDVDDAFARGSYKTMCVGLGMKDDDTREYTAEQLIKVEDPIAVACLCEQIADEKTGWDHAIAQGLKGTQRDEIASCFAALVSKPDLPERLEAVVALANIPAKAARDVLAQVATAPGDAEVRARAVTAIGGDVTYKTQVFALTRDPEVAVRSAATTGISNYKDDAEAGEALKAIAANDADPAVRASALTGLRKTLKNDADPILCEAMMKDPEPEVRAAAVGTFRATKRKEALDCLRTRAMTYEESASVRSEVLAVLKSSPSADAKKILCDGIPFWVRSYLKEGASDKVPGTNIIEVQNDRDWEKSYECLQKAYRSSGGYSCYAKMEVGYWFNKVGGTVYVPNCPGYEPAEP